MLRKLGCRGTQPAFGEWWTASSRDDGEAESWCPAMWCIEPGWLERSKSGKKWSQRGRIFKRGEGTSPPGLLKPKQAVCNYLLFNQENLLQLSNLCALQRQKAMTLLFLFAPQFILCLNPTKDRLSTAFWGSSHGCWSVFLIYSSEPCHFLLQDLIWPSWT